MAGLLKKRFDPEGSEYDYSGARSAGLASMPVEHDDVPHWPTRDPMTGMVFKGRNHPTFKMAIDEDAKMGYRLVKRGKRYYTILGDDGGDF